jgi:hypothetical protein
MMVDLQNKLEIVPAALLQKDVNYERGAYVHCGFMGCAPIFA